MTISPEYSRLVAQRVRAIYQEADDLVLQRLLASLAKGLDSPDWLNRKQADLQDMLRHVDRHLEQLDQNAPPLISRAIAEAYQAGQEAADVDWRAAGREAIGGPAARRGVDVLAEDTVRALSGLRPRMLREAADIYQRVTADAAAQVLAGTQSTREAARDAVRRYTLEGVKPFRDSAGRQWETGAYAEMATRTTAGQAAIAGHTDQLQALGHDLVIVSTSPEGCSLCGPWEGRVLSISGGSTGRASDGTRIAGSIARARSAGLQHPNCTHTVGIYLPGITKPDTTTRDPEGHRVRQQQRSKERAIRRDKRAVLIEEETMGKDSAEARKARARLRARQADFRHWREENGRKDLSYRTNLEYR